MVTIENTMVFSSILLLVVIELSKTFRSKNYQEIASQRRNSFFWFFPNLGPLSYTHFVNSFILSAGYIVAIGSQPEDSGSYQVLLVAMFLGLFMLLPYLEIEEYDSHQYFTTPWNSLYTHLFLSFIIGVFPFIITNTFLVNQFGEDLLAYIGGYSWVVIVMLGSWCFLKQLRGEYQRAEQIDRKS